MADRTVSAGYTKALFDVAVSRGADQEKLAACVNLDLETLNNPETRVSFAVFKALMLASKTACNDPAFGLHFGETSHFEDMSIVGLICHAAGTMGEAFAQMNRFARLAIEVDGHDTNNRFDLIRIGQDLWLEDQRRNPNDFPELTESTFARFICDTKRHFGDAPFARAVHFTHSAPAYRAEHDRVLGVPLVFNSDKNAILIHDSWLSIPINHENKYVFGIFSERAEALLKSLENAATTKGDIETRIIPILHTGLLSMDQIAKAMGLSRTTLYRRLKEEGVNFDALVDALRHKMALHYLDGKKVSVNETAYLVGFSDPTAFSRAFKRWTGKSPAKRKVGAQS